MPRTRELLLARHGRAERSVGDDRERRLTSGGKRDVQRLGAHLRAQGWLPGATLASPAMRARVTAETMLEAAGLTCGELQIEPRIYEASCGELLAVLGGVDAGADRVLVVGHNPAIERAASFLAGASTSFEPGMLARLIMPADWSVLDPGCGTLAGVVRASELPEIAH